mmetsp:Transcript_85473/g.142326  ORF Transcript_85473/g.142326 Transcript_85473/m.142326 type:complete len:201 (+) Transcript_85473:1256-1858(+)
MGAELKWDIPVGSQGFGAVHALSATNHQETTVTEISHLKAAIRQEGGYAACRAAVVHAVQVLQVSVVHQENWVGGVLAGVGLRLDLLHQGVGKDASVDTLFFPGAHSIRHGQHSGGDHKAVLATVHCGVRLAPPSLINCGSRWAVPHALGTALQVELPSPHPGGHTLLAGLRLRHRLGLRCHSLRLGTKGPGNAPDHGPF